MIHGLESPKPPELDKKIANKFDAIRRTPAKPLCLQEIDSQISCAKAVARGARLCYIDTDFDAQPSVVARDALISMVVI